MEYIIKKMIQITNHIIINFGQLIEFDDLINHRLFRPIGE
jgi:hypothetical protein